jgi:hypothetical protein
MPNMTDRNHAREIANIMRTSWFRAVHVKTHTTQELRCRWWRGRRWCGALIHCVAAQLACIGGRASRADWTRVQSSPSSSADNCMRSDD